MFRTRGFSFIYAKMSYVKAFKNNYIDTQVSNLYIFQVQFFKVECLLVLNNHILNLLMIVHNDF